MPTFGAPHIGGSGDRTRSGRTGPCRERIGRAIQIESKKAPWKLLPDVWALIKPRRAILAVGFLLMLINRLAGLVAPGSLKYLFDNVIGKHQAWLLEPLVGTRPWRHDHPGSHLLFADPASLEIVAAHDHRIASQGAGAHRPAAGGVLRREQDRRAGLADHERRRRDSESDRHRTHRFCRRHHDGGLRARISVTRERFDDGSRFRGRAGFRIWPEPGAQDNSPDVSRAAKDQRRSHRQAHRIARRRARGEGLSRGRARGEGVSGRRAAPARQRAANADGDFADELLRHGSDGRRRQPRSCSSARGIFWPAR